jgi:hypothetical protein
MGGTALKHLGLTSRRVSSAEYVDIANIVIDKLKNLLQQIHIVEFFRNKESHGDIDILVVLNENLTNDVFIEKVCDLFNTDKYYYNDKCLSFHYDSVQIDIIICYKEYFNITKYFYSYNDLSTLMGRLCKNISKHLKYGAKGLVVEFNYKNNKSDFTVSTDIKKILEFLDLDYETYIKGFDNLDEIFNYIVKSKYFCSKFFIDRDYVTYKTYYRDVKRTNYMLFCDYIVSNGIGGILYDKISDEDFYKLIDTVFNTETYQMFENIKKEIDIYNLVSEKVNGDIIIKLIPDIDRKIIGSLKKSFIVYYGYDFILSQSNDAIEYMIEVFYNKIYKYTNG